MISLSLVVGVALGVIVFRDAIRHGYDSMGALFWAAGTLALWFIVVPVYFLFGRRRRMKLQREDASDTVELAKQGDELIDVSEKVVCPDCSRLVPSSFSRCPGCGRELRNEDNCS